MIADLHCHTRLSDGSMSIDDLVYYGKRAGLDFVAITDHDTMDGVTRAAVLGKRYGISVVPGVEISCCDKSRGRPVHMLCYLPDKPDRLQGLFNQILESRTEVGKKMIRTIKRYFPVTDEHIARYTSGSKSIYKSHIAHALADLGYDNRVVGSLYGQLFEGEDAICANVSKVEYPDVNHVLDTVYSAGGIAVMAHPTVYDSMELMMELAQKERIQGVEAFHYRVGEKDLEAIEKVAQEHGLILTGGSDFHGLYGGTPRPLASGIVDEKWINALFGLKKNMPKK